MENIFLDSLYFMKNIFLFFMAIYPALSIAQRSYTFETNKHIKSFTVTDPSSKNFTTYYFIEQMPQFNGDIHQYLKEKQHYPPQAKRQHREGKVVIKFTVDTLGKIRQPEIIRSTDTIFNKEALRIVKEMPPWKPGKNNGQKINVTYSLPINFRLD